jgi:tripartite-type tricarboxylate transporter receptor subunit TctC
LPAADLLSAARAKPGQLTIGSVGPGTAQHVAFETLRQAADVNITFVPYAGNAPVVSAILGAHLDSAWVNYPDVGQQIRAGKLRAVATTLRDRFEELPNVPTIAESGFKNFQSETWAGLVAPAKTPSETITQLSIWFAEAMQALEVKANVVAAGLRLAA